MTYYEMILEYSKEDETERLIEGISGLEMCFDLNEGTKIKTSKEGKCTIRYGAEGKVVKLVKKIIKEGYLPGLTIRAEAAIPVGPKIV